ncbi:MAG TPA: hypothetical protein PKM72_03355 [Nitrospirales bacterium]|nr:hypothetical protein [Nitrospirales bacterium]
MGTPHSSPGGSDKGKNLYTAAHQQEHAEQIHDRVDPKPEWKSSGVLVHPSLYLSYLAFTGFLRFHFLVKRELD